VRAGVLGSVAEMPPVSGDRLDLEATPQPCPEYVLQASWASTNKALAALEYPFNLVEATARFRVGGGPMYNLLRTTDTVLIVGLHVTIEGKSNAHCIMLSTLSESHAPYGKLMDNHGKMMPVYIEANDRRNPVEAKGAFRKFLGQNPAVRDREFAVDVSDIYELQSTLINTPTAPVQPTGEARLCSSCDCPVAVQAYSRSQLAKGAKRRCNECVQSVVQAEKKRPMHSENTCPNSPRKAQRNA
jgi:hypothetical protein